jgi:hypothetical protein
LVSSSCSGVTEMIVSLNEVESTIRKAFRGAGYHWGEAEEAGKAAVWLARRKLPVTKPFLQLLRSLDGPPASRRPVITGNMWAAASSKLCPVLAGIALCDAAMDLQLGSKICFENLLLPDLLSPFASLAANESQLNLSLRWQGNRIVVQGNEFYSDLTSAEDQATASLSVRSRSGTFEAVTVEEQQTLDTDSEMWTELNRFAAETYVPASARSRAVGAGAGLTDND